LHTRVGAQHAPQTFEPALRRPSGEIADRAGKAAIELGGRGVRYSSPPRRRASLISWSLASVIGVHSLLCPAAWRASPTSMSLAEDNTPARSIRSSRDTVVSHVQGVKPG